MWKKVLMHAAKKLDHLHAVQSVIDYSVKEPPHFQLTSANLLRNLWKYGLTLNVQSNSLNPEKYGREINGAGTNMTIPFQFTNTNQEQVLSVHS